jgi:hypothetical protein
MDASWVIWAVCHSGNLKETLNIFLSNFLIYMRFNAFHFLYACFMESTVLGENKVEKVVAHGFKQIHL